MLIVEEAVRRPAMLARDRARLESLCEPCERLLGGRITRERPRVAGPFLGPVKHLSRNKPGEAAAAALHRSILVLHDDLRIVATIELEGPAAYALVLDEKHDPVSHELHVVRAEWAITVAVFGQDARR